MKKRIIYSLIISLVFVTLFAGCDVKVASTSSLPLSQDVKKFRFTSGYSTDGNGEGVITGTLDNGYYEPGTEIRLEAVAKEGSFFLGWYDYASKGNIISRELTHKVTLSENIGIYARFDSINITFPDNSLEQAVRFRLYKDIQLTYYNISAITGYFGYSGQPAGNYKITNLKGIEYFTGVTQLNLQDHYIKDISYVKNLTQLNNFYFLNNEISDISPLSNLVQLAYVDLSNNRISDISPLGTLNNIVAIYIGNNLITDISPLKHLSKVKTISIYGNQISDISALEGLSNLTNLVMFNNNITDISPLLNNKHIDGKASVWLGGNDIKEEQIQALRDKGVAVYTNVPQT